MIVICQVICCNITTVYMSVTLRFLVGMGTQVCVCVCVYHCSVIQLGKQLEHMLYFAVL